MTTPIKTSEDTLLAGRVRIVQPVQGYRAAIDPVLLAAAIPESVSGEVLDMGCGAGAVMLCLLARLPELTMHGLEINPDMAALAEESLALNGWSGRGRVTVGDGRTSDKGRYGAVVSNPPYYASGSPSPDAGKALAHSESIPLAEWIDACLKRLKDGGLLALIHRAEALGEILAALQGRAGAVEVFPLWSKAGQPAYRVIVRARKGRRSPLVLHPGLIVHRADGGYTPEAERLLREGHSLDAVLGL